MRFQILGQRVVIEPRIPEFSSILERPEIAKRDYAEDGIIVQVGPDAPKHLEVGMHVGFHPGVGEILTVGGKEYLVINSGDIRGWFKPKEDEPSAAA